MKKPYLELYLMMLAILPFVLILVGGLGALYSFASETSSPFFTAFCLLILFAGVSLYTYEQAKRNKFLRQKLGEGDKKSKRKHRKMGKKCPQCERLIYHRRTVCQHCGYVFPSHKPATTEATPTKVKTEGQS